MASNVWRQVNTGREVFTDDASTMKNRGHSVQSVESFDLRWPTNRS